jgi:hypothetical protein
MHNPSSKMTIDDTILEMRNLEAAITICFGLSEYALRPLARAALNLLEVYQKAFDLTYDPAWYQHESQRLDELPNATVQSALQKNWQILYDHLAAYRQ